MLILVYEETIYERDDPSNSFKYIFYENTNLNGNYNIMFNIKT